MLKTSNVLSGETFWATLASIKYKRTHEKVFVGPFFIGPSWNSRRGDAMFQANHGKCYCSMCEPAPKIQGKSLPTHQEVSEARWKRFEKEFEVYERKQEYLKTLDSFLELYGKLKTQDSFEIRYRLVSLMFEMKRLNANLKMEVNFS